MNKPFVITIGRQYGSGGREIGRRVAEILNIPFYDKNIVTEAARKSGLSDEMFREKDERSPITWLHALNTGFGTTTAFTSETLFRIQSDTIREIAAQGPCVIVGRSADYILRNVPDCFNVFIHAPYKDRIDRVMLRNSLNEKEAAERIARTDKSRSSFYGFYTDKKWGDSRSYDITLDSAILGVGESARLIADFVKGGIAAGHKSVVVEDDI